MAETGWHFHGEGLAWSNDRCKAQREGVWARPAVVLPLDGLEETIAREVRVHQIKGVRQGFGTGDGSLWTCLCGEVGTVVNGTAIDALDAWSAHFAHHVARALAGDGAR